VGLLVAVAAAGAILFYVVPMIRGKSAEAAPPAQVLAPAKPAAKPRPAPAAAAPAPAPGVKSASEAMARAKAAMDAGDYAGAVIAYNAALTLDPGFEDARTGLAVAAEQYKVQKAERDQIDRAKTTFAEGEFTPALKILYRIPEGRYTAEIERHKANAWFNNGLVSLRAGNCKEAQEHFAEALQIRSGDPDVLRARNMAQRFQAAQKDRAFYDAAEGIPFRKFDE
jgi:tetratricopeptide (TPR) repeat protein